MPTSLGTGISPVFQIISRAIGGAVSAIFSSILKATIVNEVGTVSSLDFARAENRSFSDFEGLIKTAGINEVRFEGARRVKNEFLKSEDFTDATWGVYGATKVGVVAGVGPAGESAMEISFPTGAAQMRYTTLTVAGNDYVEQYWIRTVSGTSSIKLGTGTGATTGDLPIDTNWRILSHQILGAGALLPTIQSNTAGTTGNFYILKAQREIVTGQTNQNPSEYVSSGVLTAPFHGAGVDGVKYFPYENGNSVLANVITEATGPKISEAIALGEATEPQVTNKILQSQDLSTTWSAPNSTVVTNATVAPDGTNTADKLVCNGAIASHQVFQIPSIGADNEANTYSVYSKAAEWAFMSMRLRKKDNTTVEQVFDLTNGVAGASAGTGFTTGVSYVGNGWYRCSVTVADMLTGVAAPAVWLFTRPANTIASASGDSTSGSYFWGAQLETGSIAHSYIPTTTVAVTKSPDALSYTGITNFPTADIFITAELAPMADGANYITTNGRVFGTDDSRGVANQLRTLIGTSYNYIHNTGGGYFVILNTDLVKDESAIWGFFLKQNGANIDWEIWKTGVVVGSGSVAGTLDHSNNGILKIASWNSQYFSTRSKNWNVYNGATITLAERAVASVYNLVDELGNQFTDEFGNTFTF